MLSYEQLSNDPDADLGVAVQTAEPSTTKNEP